MKKYKLSILEENQGTMIYLLLLYEKGDMYNKEFIDLGMNAKTVENIRGNLVSADLITLDWRKVNGRNRLYSCLTDAGKEIGSLLKSIENQLPDKLINQD